VLSSALMSSRQIVINGVIYIRRVKPHARSTLPPTTCRDWRAKVPSRVNAFPASGSPTSPPCAHSSPRKSARKSSGARAWRRCAVKNSAVQATRLPSPNYAERHHRYHRRSRHVRRRRIRRAREFLHARAGPPLPTGYCHTITVAARVAATFDPFHAPNTEDAGEHDATTLNPASPIPSSPETSTKAAIAAPRGRVLGESTSNPPPQPAFVTHAELSAALDLVARDMQAAIVGQQPSQPVFVTPSLTFSGPAATTPVNTATFAVSQKIDKLENTTLTNATVNGLAGLTDADLPDSLTASNYLPLAGGTLMGDLALSGTLTAGSLSVAGISSSGALIGPYVMATSTNATSTFAGGFAVETSGPRLRPLDRPGRNWHGKPNRSPGCAHFQYK
jgi:hypothetical protein